MGEIKPTSLGGAKYIITFIDNHTNFVTAITIKKKSDAMAEFIKFQRKVENLHGKKIKELQSDNGGEYRSNAFIQHLNAEGILHRLSVPRNPQQNGKAERMNKTLMTVLRSLLIQSRLPNYFWAKALNTASYLRNLSPSVAIENQVPLELWRRKKVEESELNALRVFGCQAWPAVESPGKLNPRAERCVFIGYQEGVKGYRP